MSQVFNMKASEISRIIEMAWEDRTPFEAIEETMAFQKRRLNS